MTVLSHNITGHSVSERTKMSASARTSLSAVSTYLTAVVAGTYFHDIIFPQLDNLPSFLETMLQMTLSVISPGSMESSLIQTNFFLSSLL